MRINNLVVRLSSHYHLISTNSSCARPEGRDKEGIEMAIRIDWLTGEDEAVEQAKKTGRAIMLDFFKPT
jgi:hypothetical protein